MDIERTPVTSNRPQDVPVQAWHDLNMTVTGLAPFEVMGILGSMIAHARREFERVGWQLHERDLQIW